MIVPKSIVAVLSTAAFATGGWLGVGLMSGCDKKPEEPAAATLRLTRELGAYGYQHIQRTDLNDNSTDPCPENTSTDDRFIAEYNGRTVFGVICSGRYAHRFVGPTHPLRP